MKHARILIAGTRYWRERDLLLRVAQLLPIGVTVLHGYHGNVDIWFDFYCRELGIETEPHPAQWGKYGKAAGPRRNQEMINTAHYTILFWDGVSPGTKDTLKRARKAGLPGRIIYSKPTSRIIGYRVSRI